MGVAKALVKILTLSGCWLLLFWLVGVLGLAFALPFCALVSADFVLYIRAPYPELLAYRFEWCPVGDGFYCWWMMRKPRKGKHSWE